MKEQIQSDIDELQNIANRLFDLRCNMLKDHEGFSIIELKEAISEIIYQRFRLEKHMQWVIAEFRLCSNEINVKDSKSLKEDEA